MELFNRISTHLITKNEVYMLDIIIVEDNHEIGQLLSDFLRKENYIVSISWEQESGSFWQYSL